MRGCGCALIRQLPVALAGGPSATKSGEWYDSRMHFEEGDHRGGNSSDVTPDTSTGNSPRDPLGSEEMQYGGGDAYHLTAKRPVEPRAAEEARTSALAPLRLCRPT